MKKLVVVAIATALAGLGLVAAAPGAQAYPDAAVSVSVDHQKVVGGSSVTATASSSVACGWKVSFLGESRTGAGTSFSATFGTPKVRKSERRDLTATCTYVSDSGTSTVTRTVPITIVPRHDAVSAPTAGGSGNGSGSANGAANGSGSAAAPASGSTSSPRSTGGLLPGTGGPDAAYLLGGLVLLALGTGALVVSRRRASRI
jgi:hypothetical protein